MTPAMKAILAGLAEQRLSQIQKEEQELRQVIRELQRNPSTTNGYTNEETLDFGEVAAEPEPEPVRWGALERRLEQLREQHGHVYVIDPKKPVNAGQRIKWGKAGSEKTVEVLETAELSDKNGDVIKSRYFAKLIDL